MPENSTLSTLRTAMRHCKLPRWAIALAILLVVAIIGGVVYWRTQTPRHISYAEVVSYDSAAQSLLLVVVDDEQGNCTFQSAVSLFTIGLSGQGSSSAPKVYDENGKRTTSEVYEDTFACGTIVEITGDDYWLYSSPAQYPTVYKLQAVGSRADFITPYLEELIALANALAEEQNFTPLMQEDVRDKSKNTLAYREQKSEITAVVYAEIDALEALTTSEKNALSYWFDCTLAWHW